ncbi:50S ribosomal protein L21 [bacterium]|nr:50S ribosomal protein L21 [candidate division CSSED10-310 bacterium]
MFAVIKSGGKQYRVAKDSVVKLEKLDGEIGNQIEIDKVLLVNNQGQVTVGTPFVEGSKIKATIIDQDKARKIRVFKMKRRKRYRRTLGHRQHFTKVRIDDIVLS